jgi:hypothetical protein
MGKIEIYDHKLTQKEAEDLGYESNEGFNEWATARALYRLYTWRHDDKMAAYYKSKIVPYIFQSKGRDCLARDPDTGRVYVPETGETLFYN